MEVKGIYRVSGNKADVEIVQQKFEEGKCGIVNARCEEVVTCGDVCSLN